MWKVNIYQYVQMQEAKHPFQIYCYWSSFCLLSDAHEICYFNNNTMIIFISVHFIVGCNRQSDSDSHRRDWLRKDNSDHPVSGRGWLHHDRKNRLHSATSCRRHVRGKKSVRRVWVSSRSRGKFGWKLFIGQKIQCIGSRALQHLI